MPQRLAIFVPVVSLLVSFAVFAAPVQFIADDGRGSINTGPAAFESVDVVWGNYFTTDVELEIAQVSVAFGRVAEDKPVTVFVLNDPDNDNDPRNASLVGWGSGLVTTPNANNAAAQDIFTSYALTSGPAGGSVGTVTGGFFVGALISDLDALNARPGQNGLRDAPARRDQDSADGKGWFFFGPGNQTDLNNLGGLPVGVNVGSRSVFGSLAGNNLVRAISVPEPTVLGLASVGLLLRRRRRH